MCRNIIFNVHNIAGSKRYGMCITHSFILNVVFITRLRARLHYNKIVLLLIIFALRSPLLCESFKNNISLSVSSLPSSCNCNNCGLATSYWYTAYTCLLPGGLEGMSAKKQINKTIFHIYLRYYTEYLFLFIAEVLSDLYFDEFDDTS